MKKRSLKLEAVVAHKEGLAEKPKIVIEDIALAKNECCNWHDGGKYCPLCEINEDRACVLLVGKPCRYFDLSVRPLFKTERWRSRRILRNGKVEE